MCFLYLIDKREAKNSNSLELIESTAFALALLAELHPHVIRFHSTLHFDIKAGNSLKWDMTEVSCWNTKEINFPLTEKKPK